MDQYTAKYKKKIQNKNNIQSEKYKKLEEFSIRNFDCSPKYRNIVTREILKTVRGLYVCKESIFYINLANASN